MASNALSLMVGLDGEEPQFVAWPQHSQKDVNAVHPFVDLMRLQAERYTHARAYHTSTWRIEA